MKNHLYRLIFAAFAATSGSSQATTFDAGVSWYWTAEAEVAPLTTWTRSPTGATAKTIPYVIPPRPSEPALLGPYCGTVYLNPCYASSSSSNASMATEAVNNGLGTLVATAGFTDTFTNTSGQSQSYAFDFHLANAQIYSRSWYGVPVESKITADILINGVSVWNTRQTWLEDQNGSHFSSSGADISSGLTIDQWGVRSYDYSSSVNIGSFENGSSFTVQYVLSSYATASDPYVCGFECQEARARIDDPFAVNAASAIRVTSNVPEPETYALFAAGLAMVIGARRRAMGSKKHTLDC